MADARYAVYFAPRGDTPLARAGNRWLGRDAAGGVPQQQPACPGIAPARLAELTAVPRRYGLHGTLKPPFRLLSGHTPDDLLQAVAALAQRQQPFAFGVRLAMLAGFFAWIPAAAHAAIGAVAAACVTELDVFRQPADQAELARRSKNLSPAQEALLLRWGYPYVLDEFRFHLTLSDRVAGVEAEALRAALVALTPAHAGNHVAFDSLCLFVEPAPGADFRLLARCGFDGMVTRHG